MSLPSNDLELAGKAGRTWHERIGDMSQRRPRVRVLGFWAQDTWSEWR